MSQREGNHDEPDDAEEEFPLGEPGPSLADYEPAVYPRRGAGAEEDQPGKEAFQFTLAELFWLVTGVALVLGILGCIPGGFSAEALAGLSGLGVLVSLYVLAVVQPERPIIRVAWWLLLVAYALSSLVAVVRNSV